MRVVRAGLAGVGCVLLSGVTFGLVIAWADYSVAKRPMTELGIAGAVVFALWLVLGRWVLGRPRR